MDETLETAPPPTTPRKPTLTYILNIFKLPLKKRTHLSFGNRGAQFGSRSADWPLTSGQLNLIRAPFFTRGGIHCRR